MAKYYSTKTYGTDRGYSCCFRQWRADHSHCSTLHGYSLGFKFIWESDTLDDRNWVLDFGNMRPIKEWLDYMFDHTVLVSADDPALEKMVELSRFSTNPKYDGKKGLPFANSKPHDYQRILDLRIVPAVGCEMTAKLVYDRSVEFLKEMQEGKIGRYIVGQGVRLKSVEVFEHGANSAIYEG